AVWVDRAPVFGLRRGEVYRAHAEAFAFVRERMTPQDRVAVVGRFTDFALAPKTPTLFRVPAIFDYEAQTSLRYADFFTFMRLGRTVQNIDDWYWPYDKLLPATVQHPLFDLTAARYLLVDPQLDTVPAALPSGIRSLGEVGGVRVYENLQALPRARFVPAIAVVADGGILATLAAPRHDARSVAPVEHALPADAGGAPGASATATIATDEPEQVAA